MNECLACQVIQGQIQPPGGVIYETECWIVNHCISPALLPGFLIIQPKRHCEHLAELTSEEASEFGIIMQLTCRALTKVVEPEKVYLCSFGETLKHIHFWVVPRYSNISTDGLKGLQEIVVNKRYVCSDEDATAIADKVRIEFRTLLMEIDS